MVTLCMLWRRRNRWYKTVNPLNAELNPICHFLALLGAHHILHVSRIRVKYKTRWYKYTEALGTAVTVGIAVWTSDVA